MAERDGSIRPAQRRTSAEIAILATALTCGSGLLPESAAALTVCDREKGIVEVDKTPAELPKPPVDHDGKPVKMTKAELDRFMGRVSACFMPPVGVARVKMHFALNPDGTVLGMPYIVDPQNDEDFRAVAKAGCRAILRCQPYPLPADKYPAWSEVTLYFDLGAR